MATIAWFRNDLRLADNPMLGASQERGEPIIPVFIWSPHEESPWAPGAASRWWLHQSLANLGADLEALGSRLILRRGPALDLLRELVSETGARSVLWNREYEPANLRRDREVQRALSSDRIEARGFEGALLHEPEAIATRSGDPFRMFTPFWRACLEEGEPPEPLPRPRRLDSPETWPRSISLVELELEPTIDWAAGIRSAWHPGEKGAASQLQTFVDGAVGEYTDARDRLDLDATTRISPHLHFGEVGPRQVWHSVREAEARLSGGAVKSAAGYLRQLGWREFAHHLLYHFPYTTDQPLRPEFERFPWEEDEDWLVAWQRGQTGYPVIDAGMRQLWATGWMHNRARMVAASFLVKDLLIPWLEGARWFWDTLVDADLANNTLGWQWTAGCGADAAPFFRIFNPVLQGLKFDPDGKYVRRWVPELSELPTPWIHKPWEADQDVLKAANVTLGNNYPHPLVDHGEARVRALAALETIKKADRLA